MTTTQSEARCPSSCTDPDGTLYRCPGPAGHESAHGDADWAWVDAHPRARRDETPEESR